MAKKIKRRAPRPGGKDGPWYMARRKEDPPGLAEQWEREKHQPRSHHQHHWDGKRKRDHHSF